MLLHTSRRLEQTLYSVWNVDPVSRCLNDHCFHSCPPARGHQHQADGYSTHHQAWCDKNHPQTKRGKQESRDDDNVGFWSDIEQLKNVEKGDEDQRKSNDFTLCRGADFRIGRISAHGLDSENRCYSVSMTTSLSIQFSLEI